ncbi:hypothetical protein HG530_005153 [Fusarium avenaceum]|nr:hypothetical protein HG530_005153 [Fusarium avenaceum]
MNSISPPSYSSVFCPSSDRGASPTLGVLLGHEQGVKVPESSLDELVRRHLLETHLEEDLSELVSHLVERVQSAGVLVRAEGLEVVGLEVGCLPRSGRNHVGRQICLLLLNLQGKLGALLDLEADDLLHLDQFSLSQVGQDLGLVGSGLLDLLKLRSGDILDRLGLLPLDSTYGSDKLAIVALLDPLLLEGLALSDLGHCLITNGLLQVLDRQPLHSISQRLKDTRLVTTMLSNLLCLGLEDSLFSTVEGSLDVLEGDGGEGLGGEQGALFRQGLKNLGGEIPRGGRA